LQSFCKAKDTVNGTKQKPSDWDKIFTNPTSDRGLNKELKKLDSRESNNSIKNGVLTGENTLTKCGGETEGKAI
jgi:serine protease inhibitor ecotin